MTVADLRALIEAARNELAALRRRIEQLKMTRLGLLLFGRADPLAAVRQAAERVLGEIERTRTLLSEEGET